MKRDDVEERMTICALEIIRMTKMKNYNHFCK